MPYVKCFVCKTKTWKYPCRLIHKTVNCSVECSHISRRNQQIGKPIPKLLKKDVGYTALHNWVKRWGKRAKWCQRCKKKPSHDLANISQKYKRDLKDWEWLCRKCHMIKDGRLKKFKALAHKIGKKYGKIYGGITATPIIQKDQEGNVLQVFTSQTEASRQTGVMLQNINHALRLPNHKTAGGFVWEYNNKGGKTKRDK